MLPPPPISTLFPYTTLFRSAVLLVDHEAGRREVVRAGEHHLVVDGDDLGVHDADGIPDAVGVVEAIEEANLRSEEHTSELQSHVNLVCRLLLEKKKKKKQ